MLFFTIAIKAIPSIAGVIFLWKVGSAVVSVVETEHALHTEKRKKQIEILDAKLSEAKEKELNAVLNKD